MKRGFQLKISLANTKPSVWRRIIVPKNMKLFELGAIIQIAFDWCGYHLDEFDIYGEVYSAYKDCYEEFEDMIDSRKIILDKIIDIGDKFKYIYDYGDYWVHNVTVEKETELDEKAIYPICIKGKMAPLPEDVGGPYGYEDFVEIINNPKHPEHKMMKEWAKSTSYTPNREELDLDGINCMLEDYKDHAELLLERE